MELNPSFHFEKNISSGGPKAIIPKDVYISWSLGFDGEHIAEAALVDDAHIGSMAQGSAEFMDITVE